VHVTQVRIYDKGSHPQLVQVVVAGVPVEGVVDTAADITIVGAEGEEKFRRVERAPVCGTFCMPFSTVCSF